MADTLCVEFYQFVKKFCDRVLGSDRLSARAPHSLRDLLSNQAFERFVGQDMTGTVDETFSTLQIDVTGGTSCESLS